jgi:two-component system chemotaxis sensor kinase CheA
VTDDDFIEVFREEAAGRLDAIDELLMGLEANGDAPDAVDALFREFHTIKGAAGLVGLSDVHELSHAAEGLLDTVRRNDAPFSAVAEALFRTAGELRDRVGGNGGVSPELVDELGRLREAVDAGVPVPEPEPASHTGSATTTAIRAPDPARAIRVPADKLDRMLDLVGETVLQRRRLVHSIEQSSVPASHELADNLALGDRLFDELKASALTMRTVPLRSVTGPFPRAVREIAAAEGKEVELEVIGADTELDRVILERIVDPLVHLLRNAVHHGIEPVSEREAAGKPSQGLVELRAKQRGALVEVTVADDGRGVSESILAEADQGIGLAEVLAKAGFSTANAVTDVAGRGVGLDAVRRQVESLGGRLEAYSRPEVGTELTLLVPLTLALLDVLLVERAAQLFALPLASVLEVASGDAPHELAGRRSIELRGQLVPLADLADVLQLDAPALPESPPALVTTVAAGQIALLCDRILGEEEIVVRTFGPALGGLRGYMGATVLGDLRVALIVDPGGIDSIPEPRGVREPAAEREPSDAPAPTVLVVEDSLTVRALQRSILEAAGYRVEVAADGAQAWERVRRARGIDLVVSDIDMPRMDGVALVEAIRADPERSALPVVLVTARSGDEDRVRGLRAGADAYLEKAHFDQHALLEAVDRLLGR